MNLFQFQNQSHGRKAILSTVPIIDLRTYIRQNTLRGDCCVEFVCFEFTFSVTQLPFVTVTFQRIFGRGISLVNDKVHNNVVSLTDTYILSSDGCDGVCVSRYYRWKAQITPELMTAKQTTTLSVTYLMNICTTRL